MGDTTLDLVETARNLDRLTRVMELFEDEFGAVDKPSLAVFAPGRSELAGNHTDHEGGTVIACAIDCGISGVAYPNGLGVVRVASEGFAPFEIALDDLAPRAGDTGSPCAIVRGMAACLAESGRVLQGFDLALVSNIPTGGGLSSSAAFELAVGRVMEILWEGAPIDATTLARMAQRVENRWFGKPCGLMDQLAIALGGVSLMDFADPTRPVSRTIDFSFADHGMELVLVNVGASHDDLTAEYAAVPAEMRSVARALGEKRLGDVASEAVFASLPRLRKELGDRPTLRALHYLWESELVEKRWQALLEEDLARFLDLTNRSGASSAMFLQNVSVARASEQPAMVALALATLALGEEGACRIHGGGFGGSIQAFVPKEHLTFFVDRMNAVFGPGAARRYRIVSKGALAWWL